MSQSHIARLIFDEIEKDVRNGEEAQFLYHREESCPYPLAAAEVIIRPDGSRYIAWLAAHPDHIGKGYGAALLGRILKDCPAGCKVSTDPCNDSRGFYAKYGFQPAGAGLEYAFTV